MFLIDLWQALSSELKVFLVAMTPFFELRGAIPLGLFFYKLPLWETFVFSVLGNILVIIPVQIFLKYIVKYLMDKIGWINTLFTRIFDKTRKAHSHKMEIYGAVALIAVVAVPFPGTGGWTGALIAYLFDLPIKKSLPLISVGILIAGVIVSILSGGVMGLSL